MCACIVFVLLHTGNFNYTLSRREGGRGSGLIYVRFARSFVRCVELVIIPVVLA